MKKLRILAVIAIVAIMLLVVALPTNAAFEGVTVTVTSNVGNGTEVNPGDEITYTINMKNTSEDNYILPGIIAILPEQTEFVSVNLDQSSEYDVKDENDSTIIYMGMGLLANSEINFTLTVKVKDDAEGEIDFSHVTESDENGDGALMVYMISFDVTEEEVNDIVDAFDNIEDDDTLADIKAKLGDKCYFDLITQPQTNPIKVQKTEEEPTEEEPVEEKTEEDTNKPSKLPKTGTEYNAFALVAGLIMLAVGVKLIK